MFAMTPKSACAASAAKKRRFDPKACAAPQEKRTHNVPRAADISWAPAQGEVATQLTAAPPDLQEALEVSSSVFSFRIETHDWLIEEPKKKACIGKRFGYYALIDERNIQFQRVIQLGWAIGLVGKPPDVVKYLVQPSGFEIAPQAMEHHGIKQAEAFADGRQLKCVLQEFMTAAAAQHRQGARLVAHRFEVVAAIISQELGRCALHAEQQMWHHIAQAPSGLCLMSPVVGTWVLICAQRETKEQGYHTLALRQLADLLTPDLVALAGEKGRHDAGDGARLAYAIFACLVQRAKGISPTTAAPSALYSDLI
jgi:hypothetical protein